MYAENSGLRYCIYSLRLSYRSRISNTCMFDRLRIAGRPVPMRNNRFIRRDRGPFKLLYRTFYSPYLVNSRVFYISGFTAVRF